MQAPTQGTSTSGETSHARQSLPEMVLDLRDLVVNYFKQETLVPLQQLGRYVAFGLAGSLALGFGAVLLGVGLLRLLQEETGDTFDGGWSWAPYLIVFAALLLGGGLVWVARGARRTREEYR